MISMFNKDPNASDTTLKHYKDDDNMCINKIQGWSNKQHREREKKICLKYI